jgi:hypothetical protein
VGQAEGQASGRLVPLKRCFEEILFLADCMEAFQTFEIKLDRDGP